MLRHRVGETEAPGWASEANRGGESPRLHAGAATLRQAEDMERRTSDATDHAVGAGQWPCPMRNHVELRVS